MSFFEENNCGTKFKKSQLSWKKTYLEGDEFYIKSYVGNAPPKSLFFDDGTSKYM